MKYYNENECYGKFFLEGTKEFSISRNNTSGSTQTVQLFNISPGSEGVSLTNLVVNGGTNSLKAQQFMNLLIANPVMLFEVEIRSSSDNTNLLQPLNLKTFDLSFDTVENALIPTYNPLQKIVDRVRYNFIDNLGCPLIVDGTSNFLTYDVFNNNKITWVFKYKQLMNKDLAIKNYFSEEFKKIDALVKLNNGLSTFDLLHNENNSPSL